MDEIGALGVVAADGAVVGPAVIEVGDDGLIAAVTPRPDAGPHHLVTPGFIDLQVNGHLDVDVATARGAEWDRLDGILLDQGVTTWCPTLVTAPLDRIDASLGRIAEADLRPAPGRPAMAGVHLEGPFLGGAPGAHRPQWLLPFDREWIDALPAMVRIMTLAPELDGADDVISAVAARGVVVSLGHSTATAAQATRAARRGAGLVTHLFNGMGPLHHRHPGLVGVALADPGLTATIIADLVHVDGVAIRLAFAAKGAGRIALVTDAIAWRATGHAGFDVELRDGAPRLADGTLAGSALTMDRAIHNTVLSGVPLPQALLAASTTPARVLGLDDRGVIAPGRRADLVALGPDQSVEAVWVGGQRVR